MKCTPEGMKVERDIGMFLFVPPATRRILALLNDGRTYIHTYIYMIQTIYYYSEPVYTVY